MLTTPREHKYNLRSSSLYDHIPRVTNTADELCRTPQPHEQDTNEVRYRSATVLRECNIYHIRRIIIHAPCPYAKAAQAAAKSTYDHILSFFKIDWIMQKH